MKISFLIPFRNNESTIRKCVSSLPDDSEILLWDDHSEDSTASILKSMNCTIFKSDTRLSLGEMREELFNQSTGDIIVFQDADDSRLSARTHYCAKLVRSSEILMTPVVRVYADKLKSPKLVALKYEPIRDFFEINFQTCGMFWSRKLLSEIRFTRKHCWEYAMFYEVLKHHGYLIRYSNVVSAIYTGPGLYSATNKTGQLKARVELFHKALGELNLTNEMFNIGMRAAKTAESILKNEVSPACYSENSCLVGCYTNDSDYSNGKRCLSRCLND